jgi:hypothetical protein
MRAKENETRVKELLEELKASEDEIDKQAQRILLLESALALRQPVDARLGCNRTGPAPEGTTRSLVSKIPARANPLLPEFSHGCSAAFVLGWFLGWVLG